MLWLLSYRSVNNTWIRVWTLAKTIGECIAESLGTEYFDWAKWQSTAFLGSMYPECSEESYGQKVLMCLKGDDQNP